MPRVGAPQLMRKINQALILNLLRLNGPLSRADLSRATKLAIPTISRQIGDLIEQGYVKETHIVEAPLGKPPMMLELNAEGAFVIGMDITSTYVEVALVNLCGEVSHFHRHNTPIRLGDLDHLVEQITDVARPLLKEVPANQLLGLGIAIPGIIDTLKGEVIYAADGTWPEGQTLLLKPPLERALNIPVTINSRMRARALGEQFYGSGQGVDNFLWLYVGSRGLGAGIVLDSRLYHGSNHGSGEIGHNRVDNNPEQPVCDFCGQHGCLSVLTSYQAVMDRAQHAALHHPDSLLAGQDDITIDAIRSCAEQGDTVARDIILETGHYLGMGMADIIHLLNPSHVFMGGSVTRLGNLLTQQMKHTIDDIVLPTYRDIHIEGSLLGQYAPTIGAATLFFRNLFEPPK